MITYFLFKNAEGMGRKHIIDKHQKKGTKYYIGFWTTKKQKEQQHFMDDEISHEKMPIHTSRKYLFK